MRMIELRKLPRVYIEDALDRLEHYGAIALVITGESSCDLLLEKLEMLEEIIQDAEFYVAQQWTYPEGKLMQRLARRVLPKLEETARREAHERWLLENQEMLEREGPA